MAIKSYLDKIVIKTLINLMGYGVACFGEVEELICFEAVKILLWKAKAVKSPAF